MLKKIILALLILIVVIVFFVFDIGQYLQLEVLKSYQADLDNYYRENRIAVLFGFFLVYVLVTAVSLPGAAILTLASGALFGLTIGTILVSFASALGATFAFLSSRILIGDSIQKKYGEPLRKINDGIEKNGWVYLMTLRLAPIFPFFVINLLMGLTKMRLMQYYLVSQIAMLPGTIVYVFAGQTLSELNSVQDILSPNVLIAFFALATFPFITKFIVNKFIPKK